ncbi:4Fe-4S dicluster domain-containing protein [Maribellus sp. YY47]|uniref:4Fe-4S dicluster domain-containing protein n=1 Tax=Maribellus sp. YY47 TaxID=2929486 RepID=UPI002000A6C0|nr:4Fe-4S dicluster domain-containing protein [Maribellus sp. YY47]MCK3685715.1 4Fe-4S dicluster domain-containing protein [Maribellus sp. YY47]
MYSDLNQRLKADVRLEEGLQACMNCGICTAICPAAEFYEYDPRSIAITVQSGNEEKIAALLQSDTIWYCGQCMSCKTRCPRNNCPGLIISVLRKLSQETGAFIKSRMGRQQYLIVKTIGANLLQFGYCVHPTSLVPATHPEQGPVWRWIYENMQEVYASVGANLDGDGPGALRKISDKDLDELHQIFEVSGGLKLYQTIEYFSQRKAIELGLTDPNGEADMEKYTQYLLNE